VTTQPHLLGQPLLDESFPLPVQEPFTLTHALGAGVSRHRIRWLERRGLIRRVVRGVYVAAQVPDSRTLRAHALLLVTPDHCVVTDWTACWLWTGVLPPNGYLDDPAPSIFRQAGHDRLRNQVCSSGQRTLRPEDVTVVDGLTVTTPLRTAWDLGRLVHRDQAIGGIDALLRAGGFEKAELVSGVERFKGQRGVVQLRDLAPKADPRSESPAESTLRLRWLDLPHLPPPTPQVPIIVDGIVIYRLDLGVPELLYGCEYDGEEFHGPEQAAKDARRRDDLRDRFGWDVDAVRRGNVYGVTRDIEGILERGIIRARRRLGLPPW
jgi:hypothetical protein